MVGDSDKDTREIQVAVTVRRGVAAMAQEEEDRGEGDPDITGATRLNKGRGLYSNRSHNIRRKLAAIRSPAP